MIIMGICIICMGCIEEPVVTPTPQLAPVSIIEDEFKYAKINIRVCSDVMLSRIEFSNIPEEYYGNFHFICEETRTPNCIVCNAIVDFTQIICEPKGRGEAECFFGERGATANEIVVWFPSNNISIIVTSSDRKTTEVSMYDIYFLRKGLDADKVTGYFGSQSYFVQFE